MRTNARVSEETKQNILIFYLKNKNNSLKYIAKYFETTEDIVNGVINRSFREKKVETFIVLESKMNFDETDGNI